MHAEKRNAVINSKPFCLFFHGSLQLAFSCQQQMAVRIYFFQTDEVWAKELIRLGTADRDRAEGRSVVRSAGYDIVEETKRLQEIYVSLIEK